MHPDSIKSSISRGTFKSKLLSELISKQVPIMFCNPSVQLLLDSGDFVGDTWFIKKYILEN
jgi:hypothetical protein